MVEGTIKRFNQGDIVKRIGWNDGSYKGKVIARYRSWEDGEMYCIVKNFTGEKRWVCREDYLEAA